MTDQEYNALDALETKKKNHVYRIRPTATLDGSGPDASLDLRITLRDLQQARPGTGARHSIGFALGPVEFSLPDGRSFQLYSGWVTLTAR